MSLTLTVGATDEHTLSNCNRPAVHAKNFVPRSQGHGGDKCIIPELGDRDPEHPRFQIPEKVPQQVMRHGPRGAHMTKRHEDGFRLRGADPKGEDFSAGLDVFQNQNGRPALGIGNHAPDHHPLQGRSGPVGGKREEEWDRANGRGHRPEDAHPSPFPLRSHSFRPSAPHCSLIPSPAAVPVQIRAHCPCDGLDSRPTRGPSHDTPHGSGYQTGGPRGWIPARPEAPPGHTAPSR